MTNHIESYLDYAALKPDVTENDVIKLCEEARAAGCASVCINPHYVSLAKNLLAGSQVKVCTVVGFPLGATLTEVKEMEAGLSIVDGAQEIDMVMNIAALKNKEYDEVREDIAAVSAVCQQNKVLLKVIIETCLLTNAEKIIACKLAIEGGADFVKTSTGFSTGGATVEDVALLKKTAAGKAKIKASGGIRDYATAIAMLAAGADRIGASKLMSKE